MQRHNLRGSCGTEGLWGHRAAALLLLQPKQLSLVLWWACSWDHHCQLCPLLRSSCLCFLAAHWEQMSQSLFPSVPVALA